MIQAQAAAGDDASIRRSLTEALCAAAKHGSIACVKTLCAAMGGANIDLDDIHGNGEGHNALHLAAEHGHAPCVAHLVSHGVDVNTLVWSPMVWTALSLATQRGHVVVVRLLVQAGADIERADVRGNRPRHFAALLEDPSCVSILIGAGAEIEAVNLDGRTPLHLAAFNDTRMRTLVLLLRKGAKLIIPEDNGCNTRIRKYLAIVSALGGVEAYDRRRAESFARTLRPFHARVPEEVIPSIAAFL